MRLQITSLGLAGVIALAVTSQALAGSTFRLEIGSAIAGGSGTKLKNAVVMVRALACEDPTSVVMTGSVEGIVNGVRQSVSLKLHPLPTPGVHAVTRQWPDGTWVLNLTATCPAPKATAGALVPLGANGQFLRGTSQFLERAASQFEINAALTALVKNPS
jgi:hypothetical protein